MRLSIIGSGYVGLVSGACLAELGHEVTCVDIDPAKVDQINRAESPIYEEGLDELLHRNVGKRLRATTQFDDAVMNSDVTLIAVGTPFDGNEIDLRQIMATVDSIGAVLRDKSAYHVVIVKSTVVPGTTDDDVRARLEKVSGKRAGPDFGVGMNPEFLTEGTAVKDFMEPDRIVLGGIDDRTVDMMAKLYASFRHVPILRTNNRTAEMIKYTSNSLLATLISFSNEIGNLCARLPEVDVTDVMRGVHLSHYLTVRSNDGNPVTADIAAFLGAGCGFGGSCLPKDVKALVARAKTLGQPMDLLQTVIDINLAQPGKVLEILKQHLGELKRRRIAILGLAFKPDTDDVRESPAFPIMRLLLAQGAQLKAYDPIATERARQVLGDESVNFVRTLADAVDNVDAAVVVTSWSEFRTIPELLKNLDAPPLLVDGRRMFRVGMISRYAGIGLSTKVASS